MKFMDQLNFSKKLYLLLSVPVLALVLYTMISFYNTYADAKKHDEFKQLVRLSVKVSDLLHETQKERGLSAGFIGSKGAKFHTQLLKQRQQTDTKIQALAAFLKQLKSDSDIPELKRSLEKSMEKVRSLPAVRTSVDQMGLSAKSMISTYTSMNSALLDAIASIVKTTEDVKISNELNGYLNFLQAKERMDIERAVGTATLANGGFEDGMRVYIVKLIAQHEAFLKNFYYYSPASVFKAYQNVFRDPVVQRVGKIENELMNANGMQAFSTPAQKWFDSITHKINKFKKVENLQAKHIIHTAQQLYDRTWYMLVAFFLINTLLFVIIGIVTFMMTKRLSKQVDSLQQGLRFFLSYVAREKDYIKPLKVEGKDEFAEMTKMINVQIEKITKIIEQDKRVVGEIEEVVRKVNNGFFGNSVKESGASIEVEQLRNSLNEMLMTTKEKFAALIELLNHFSQGQFDYEIPHDRIKGLNGDFGAVVTSAKLLGDNISELFAVIQNTGGSLTDNTKVLSESSDSLTDAAAEQHTALKNTTNVLDHMKKTTRESIADIRRSSSMADQLAQSSEKGLVLATKTAEATDEINEKVEAINEAISIIDQIAFQTNILSLNAAVEAATAGEAGKGFSVVAQEVRSLAAKSAEAAAEIKLLVESAKSKSVEGKAISEEMIAGYERLKNEINATKNVIETVAYKSEIQEKDMVEIDKAVEKMNRVVSENVKMAAGIDNLSRDIRELSTDLFHIVSTASFKEEIRNQVCDVKMNETIAHMKHKHLIFKTKILEKLEIKKRFDVTPPTHCDLGRWISEQEEKQSTITQSPAWSVLVNDHEKIHALAQEYVDKNAQNAPSTQLEIIATQLENATLNIFSSLDGIKRTYCDNKKERKITVRNRVQKREKVRA
ncbi:MAG: hypothetical protein DSZ05_02365 [Sulfurospirillum sp.]|nr:MAG: hypothetical protein DSZ05_02365 [Sulfurospirillum sp.]